MAALLGARGGRPGWLPRSRGRQLGRQSPRRSGARRIAAMAGVGSTTALGQLESPRVSPGRDPPGLCQFGGYRTSTTRLSVLSASYPLGRRLRLRARLVMSISACLRAQSASPNVSEESVVDAVWMQRCSVANLWPTPIRPRNWLGYFFLFPFPPGSNPGGPGVPPLQAVGNASLLRRQRSLVCRWLRTRTRTRRE